MNSTFSFKAHSTLIYLTLYLCCKRGLFRLLEHLGGKKSMGIWDLLRQSSFCEKEVKELLTCEGSFYWSLTRRVA